MLVYFALLLFNCKSFELYMTLVEICTDNLKDTVEAIRLGADRIELCSDLEQDGLTPTDELFDQVMALSQLHGVSVFPMVRSRPGDFIYSPDEKRVMVQQAVQFTIKGVPGLVIGALRKDGSIDLEFVKEVAQAVHIIKPDLEITFHKAIDAVILQENERLVDVVASLEPYCERVLTSGGRPTALEGASAIRELIQRKKRPFPLVAGKIREENVQNFLELTGATEIHSRSPYISRVLGKLTRDAIGY